MSKTQEKKGGGGMLADTATYHLDIKWVGFIIFRYILIHMFGPRGPKQMKVKSEGGGVLADTTSYHL